jgi:hypothetical protein
MDAIKLKASKNDNVCPVSTVQGLTTKQKKWEPLRTYRMHSSHDGNIITKIYRVFHDLRTLLQEVIS